MFDIHATSSPAFCAGVRDEGFLILDVNEACVACTGIARALQRDRAPHEIFPATIADHVVSQFQRCAASRTSISYDTEFVSPRGYTVWRTMLVPKVEREGPVTDLFGVSADVTAECLTERADKAFHEKMSLAMGTIEGGFWTLDLVTDTFEMSKPLAELIAGPGTERLTLAEYAGHIHADDLCAYGMAVGQVPVPMVEFRIIAHDGRTRWMQSKRHFVRDESGVIIRAVGLVLDITAQKRAMLLLQDAAHTDPLTRLKNRRAFEKIGGRAFRDSRTGGLGFEIILIDLRHFKLVNDRFGHAAGDDLLRQVARRLRRLMPPEATLARLGGDEFAVCLPGRLGVEADQLASRIETHFAKPFRIGQHSVQIGANCGIAVRLPTDRRLSDLLARADRRLYRSKGDLLRLSA